MSADRDAAPKAPAGVDTERPSAARMYDWYLGGDQNWAVDREFGARVERLWPQIKPVARQNRQWMNRVVRIALDAGIRQFLDLGSGVPTVGNVHEVVRDHLPSGERASVVYVDYEPVAAAHARVLLEQTGCQDWVGLVQQDLRDPDPVFDDGVTLRLLDLDQPVCVLAVAVLHFVGPADRPEEVLATYRERLASGSWLAFSHIADDDAPPSGAEEVRRFCAAYSDTSNPLWLRGRDEVQPWFGDWQVLEPGLVHLPDWRPDHQSPADDEDPARPFAWCGVAEKS